MWNVTDLVGMSGKGVLLRGVGVSSKSNLIVDSCCIFYVEGMQLFCFMITI